MVRYEKKEWRDLGYTAGAVFEDIELVACKFIGCALGWGAQTPAERTIVRRVRAERCVVDGGGDVGPVLFDDVFISDLRTTGGSRWLRAPLFRHVTLRGKFGRVVLTADRWIRDRPEQAAFDVSASEFYASVDWALDISEGRFRELDWRLNCPARLVRRDPATQVVVTRERALEGAWRKVPLHPITSGSLDLFTTSGLPDMVLVAGKASPSFKQELESIQALRDAGVVEPELH